MAKKHTSNDDDEKIVKDNIQKRFKSMFSGKGQPLSNMSIQEVEALKSRVAELEAKLDQQPPAGGEEPPTPAKTVLAISDMSPKKDIHAEELAFTAARQKQIRLWVAGIFTLVGVAFFLFALYTRFVLQGGQGDISDNALMPLTIVMMIVSLVSFRLIRVDRPALGTWLLYVVNVILPPLFATLLIAGIRTLVHSYLLSFALLFISLVIPKTSRVRAIAVVVATGLALLAIEIWNPPFRVTTTHLGDFTPGLILITVLVIILFLIIARPAAKISTKIIISTLSIFSLVLTGFFLYSYLTSRADNQARALDLSQQAEGSFNSKLQNLGDFALGLAMEAANNPEIQAAFAERDRQQLMDLTLPSFLALEKQFGIQQYQYHLPSTTSFLRLHSLEKYGDDLSTIRATVVQTNETKQPVAGLEVGRGGVGLRGVVPVFFKSRHIGAVEFGVNVDQVLVNSLKQEYGNDWRIILTRDALALATLEDISKLKEGPTPDLLVLASTIDAVYPETKTYNAVLKGERQISAFTDDQDRSYSITSLPLRDYSGKIIGVVDIIIDQTALVQTQAKRFNLMFLVGMIALLVGSYGLATITNRNLRPLGKLTEAAEAIQKGDLAQQIQVTSRDEIGQLGYTFNAMTAQLRSLIEGLERRVEERTHDLELASEVGRTATEKVTDLSGMLTDAAEMIRTRFDLYYTQIYLMDPSGERIVLRAGTGEAGKELLGRGHYLAIEAGSLNGRAVLEKQAQIVPDTRENPNFLPNPLLPNTRSEMSIPLVVEGKVVGVLDMQSEQPGALSEGHLPAFQALAGQMAIAIQNAALFAEVQESRSEAETQIRRFTEQGWQEFLDAIHQGHRIGFAFDESQVIRLKSNELLSRSDDANSFRLPITMTGTQIGEIQLPQQAKHTLTASELDLVQTTGAQLAQHVENLRLLAQAEQYRQEAEQAVRRLTHEGWDSFLQTHATLEPGYLFDLTEVKPLSEKNGDSADYAVKHAMAVGDEVIGELAVDSPGQSEEAAELLAAVAGQLSGHIENLRLSKLNEKHAQREQTLRQITGLLRSSNNPATIMRTAVRELGSIMGRRTVVQLVSPQQADQAQSTTSNENGSDTPAHQS